MRHKLIPLSIHSSQPAAHATTCQFPHETLGMELPSNFFARATCALRSKSPQIDLRRCSITRLSSTSQHEATVLASRNKETPFPKKQHFVWGHPRAPQVAASFPEAFRNLTHERPQLFCRMFVHHYQANPKTRVISVWKMPLPSVVSWTGTIEPLRFNGLLRSLGPFRRDLHERLAVTRGTSVFFKRPLYRSGGMYRSGSGFASWFV